MGKSTRWHLFLPGERHATPFTQQVAILIREFPESSSTLFAKFRLEAEGLVLGSSKDRAITACQGDNFVELTFSCPEMPSTARHAALICLQNRTNRRAKPGVGVSDGPPDGSRAGWSNAAPSLVSLPLSLPAFSHTPPPACVVLSVGSNIELSRPRKAPRCRGVIEQNRHPVRSASLSSRCKLASLSPHHATRSLTSPLPISLSSTLGPSVRALSPLSSLRNRVLLANSRARCGGHPVALHHEPWRPPPPPFPPSIIAAA